MNNKQEKLKFPTQEIKMVSYVISLKIGVTMTRIQNFMIEYLTDPGNTEEGEGPKEEGRMAMRLIIILP